MVTIRQMLMPAELQVKNKLSAQVPKWITVHNTSNDASANNEITYANRTDRVYPWVCYHYAVDDKEIVQQLPHEVHGWHAGDGSKGEGNMASIGIEICYSKSGGERFDKAEQNAAELIASILKKYNWEIDRVKKHKDWNGKNCPDRTLAYGWERFLYKISTALDGASSTPPATYQPPAKKSIEIIAKEVINGEWGNGVERKNKLTAAGYDYATVQAAVNTILSGKSTTATAQAATAPAKKSIDEIAKEVINGKWGNGAERKNKLTAAGYDYAAVQKRVNRLV